MIWGILLKIRYKTRYVGFQRKLRIIGTEHFISQSATRTLETRGREQSNQIFRVEPLLPEGGLCIIQSPTFNQRAKKRVALSRPEPQLSLNAYARWSHFSMACILGSPTVGHGSEYKTWVEERGAAAGLFQSSKDQASWRTEIGGKYQNEGHFTQKIVKFRADFLLRRTWEARETSGKCRQRRALSKRWYCGGNSSMRRSSLIVRANEC